MTESNSFNWRAILQFGLIGGLLAVYVSVIGMVEAFSERSLLGNFLTTSYLLLIGGPLGAGYINGNAIKEKPRGIIIGTGALTGLVASLPVLLLIWVGISFDLRDMFINISPDLMDLLTFGQGTALGWLLMIVLFIAMGSLGAMYVCFADIPRRAGLYGVLATLAVGLFAENVSQILQQLMPRSIARLIISQQTLNPVVAVAIFIFVVALSYWWLTRGDDVRQRWELQPQARRQRTILLRNLFILLILLTLPLLVGRFLSQVLFLVGLYVMMGLGLNIVVGYAGLLDLGYVAFFAIGAYMMGVLTTTGPLNISNLNFWVSLPIAVIVGVLFGVMLGAPVLRMRGDYLAIVTLGFGEIIRLLALSDWLSPYIGGAQGILAIPNPRLGPLVMNTPEAFYYLVVLGSLLAAFITVRLRDSRLGRQWMAMREDEDVAEAMGINLVQTKLLAFAIGAGFSALSGAIFSGRLGNIFPHSFNLLISINALSLIIVGGMGSIPGVVVGAFIMVGMPELLREFSEYRLLLYGILLIIMMLVKPEGFLPEATRKRELHSGEDPDARPLGALADTQG